MPWFKVDDDFHDHPKARKAGPVAVGVWVLCGSWSADNTTDGYVPDQVVKEKAGHNWRRYAERLVAAGLWSRVDGPPESLTVPVQREDRERTETLSRRDWGVGYQFHDWHRYQPTRDEWMAKREADAARQRASRARRKSGRHGVTPPGAKPINGATRDRRTETVSHHPDPYVPNGTSRGGPGDDDRPGNGDKNINGFHPNPSTPTGRSPETEATLAALRRRLPKGQPLRNTWQPPRVDAPREDGA